MTNCGLTTPPCPPLNRRPGIISTCIGGITGCFTCGNPCAAADTAADFFLHIVPVDVADLPAERRDAGFAHGGFAFVRQGGHFDGKCLAAVTLPDYPGGIKEMRTGQFVPGQGDLWSVVIAAP